MIEALAERVVRHVAQEGEKDKRGSSKRMERLDPLLVELYERCGYASPPYERCGSISPLHPTCSHSPLHPSGWL